MFVSSHDHKMAAAVFILTWGVQTTPSVRGRRVVGSVAATSLTESLNPPGFTQQAQ